MKNSLEVLAGTSPKITFRTYRESADKIRFLESALGLPAGKPIWNLRAAAGRISELESMVASKASAPASAPVSAPVSAPTQAARVTPGIVATAAEFLALSTTDREIFSANGGKLSVDAANNLPLTVRITHFESGGKIGVAATDKTILARQRGVGPNPANSRTMSAAAFNQLGKNDQKILIRLGLKIAAK